MNRKDEPVVDVWLGQMSGKVTPSTTKEYGGDLRHLCRWLKEHDTPLLAVTQDDLARFSRHLDIGPLSDATKHRRKGTIRLFFTWLYGEGRIELNPSRIFDGRGMPIHPKVEVMEVADLRAFIRAAVVPKDSVPVLLSTVMCLPVRDIVALNVQDLQVDEGEWRLRLSGRPLLRLPGLVSGPLEAIASGRKRGPLVLNAWGARVDRSSLSRVFDRIGKQAGLDYTVTSRLLQQSMRRLLGTNPVPMAAIEQSLGAGPARSIWLHLQDLPPMRSPLAFRAAGLVRPDSDSVDALLDVADGLSDNDLLPAAARVMLASAAFERHLRQVAIDAERLDPTERRTTISGLSGQLRGAGLLTNTQVQMCATIAEVRDGAAHGWWELVTDDLADRVLAFMRDITRSLKTTTLLEPL
jgi:integrase